MFSRLKTVYQTHKQMIIFSTLYLLMVLQVGWWLVIFLKEVTLVEQVRIEKASSQNTDELSSIRKRSHHQRSMFISESIFFIILISSGLLGLYMIQLREKKRLQNEKKFLEMVTHESKTPLTILKLRLEELINHSNLNQDIVASLRQAILEVRRLASVIDKALYLYRLKNQIKQTRSPIQLSQILEGVLHRMDLFFKSHQATIHQSIETTNDLVCVEVNHIDHALQNILENAILHHHQTKKNIHLTLSKKQGKEIVLSIKDDGPGISTEEQLLVRNKFYHGKNKQTVYGTGLGLYFADEVFKTNGGHITLQSEFGHGTQIDCSLPSV